MFKTKIIDGKKIAGEIREKLKEQVASFPVKPCLAVILVGDNPASQIYVRHKMKAAEEVGIKVNLYALSPVMTEDALTDFIKNLNADAEIDGIIVQLPLPKHMDSYRIVESIDPDKDVDGLCSRNLGKLFTGRPGLVPCTPLGCMALIHSVLPKIDGLRAVIVGRSCLVGKPVGQLLLEEQCTITQAHSHTRDLEAVCQTADILVVAAGKPNLITEKHIKKGAVIIDVGINRNADGHIVGDVDFTGVQGVAGAITPVPGGVGPMTVAMLLSNVVKIYVQKKLGKKA
ncbi:MAG: bifunctional methylenetetrahydrofolate dehydrogenase/methenyltetrahydrofolate cyclohydrolase FolD [Pseudomonadota bacterium]|nr:bifunctional methylenetetrahydrofolate dehydrogenase/methenyltetrahydrofolate cyclohydrolase FolD [Pseudomonadota bacterium]